MTRLLDNRGRPRIVVTGMGAITPVGNTVEESWESALACVSGITEITQFDARDLPCRIAHAASREKLRDLILATL